MDVGQRGERHVRRGGAGRSGGQTGLGAALALTLLALAGAAPPVGAEERAATTVALLPSEGINLGAADIVRHEGLLRVALARPGLRLAAAAPWGAAVCAPPTDARCLRETGRRLAVEKLLALRVGQLGDTLLVRLTLFDATRGALQGTWQEVLRRPDGETLRRALERMIAGFAPRPATAARPWYGRWWVWTIAGAVVAGSVTAAVLATRPRAPDADIRVRPP